MKLKILGSGNALALENYHTNFLFDPEDDTNRKLLIDCGTDIQRSLHNSGHSFNDITDVYISHFHMDHVGGLPALLTHKYFTQREKINLYLPQYRGYEELWTLLSITGFQFIKDGIKGSRHYYERMLGPKSGFSDNIRFGTPFCYANTEFIMIPVPHVKWSWDTEMSYGLFINSNTKIWITTDFVGNYNDFEQRQVYDAADIIIHDCEMGYSSGDKPIQKPCSYTLRRLKMFA